MSKYAKGEWKIVGISRSLQRFHVAADGENICAVFTSTPSAEANAKIISAAPDLLEALENIIGDIFEHVHPEDYKKCKAAIKKATE